ncbi:ShlB/FhaC/HecB family hemolysin secretion/activation protein [Halomonas koreensis]|uniref:POTRA domain-containing protein n=1 Tax=Halomonas koreensis TaxID=245385 RepID=A0ABU1G287_9GAMM|nr:POTRA domain-containing protein [Halomonas koreensis]MDR5867058.1 POTRA domain-containing protein [Halomonas koreensis]
MPRARVAAMLLVASAATASEPPAIIDERRPTLSPPIEDALDRGRQPVAVELPGTLDRLDAETRVSVSRVRIQGGNAFDLETLSAPLRPLVGQRVSVERLVRAVERITRRYQDSGFPLSYAYLPRNNFRDGQVRVVVVEGYIARSEIAVQDAAVARRVERLVSRMREERPLTRETFERYTALIERIPGVRLSVRAPVPRTPSGATTLRVEQRDSDRVDAGLALEGGSEDEARLVASLDLRSHTPHAESLSFSSLLPVDTDDRFHALAYRQELGRDGLRLQLSAQRFEGDDDTPLPSDERVRVHEHKERDRFRVGLDYPLWLERRRRWDLEATLEHLDETVDYRYTAFDRSLLTARQDLRYSTLELATRYRRGGERRRLSARAELRRGLELGGNRNALAVQRLDNGAVAVDEGDEELAFTRLALEASWLEALSPRWRLSLRLAGFWSEDDLPLAEHGRYGGRRFGRAYADDEAEGERGYAGELELRYRRPLSSAWLSRLEPYLVVDGARTRFVEGEVKHELASVATGVELRHDDDYRLGVEYALPVGDRPEDDADRRGRLNARLSWAFGG